MRRPKGSNSGKKRPDPHRRFTDRLHNGDGSLLGCKSAREPAEGVAGPVPGRVGVHKADVGACLGLAVVQAVVGRPVRADGRWLCRARLPVLRSAVVAVVREVRKSSPGRSVGDGPVPSADVCGPLGDVSVDPVPASGACPVRAGRGALDLELLRPVVVKHPVFVVREHSRALSPEGRARSVPDRVYRIGEHRAGAHRVTVHRIETRQAEVTHRPEGAQPVPVGGPVNEGRVSVRGALVARNRQPIPVPAGRFLPLQVQPASGRRQWHLNLAHPATL